MPMMTFTETTVHTCKPSKDETQRFVMNYIQELIGDGCCVTKDGRISYWEDTGHGSGLTEDHGPATDLQLKADAFRKALAAHIAAEKAAK